MIAVTLEEMNNLNQKLASSERVPYELVDALRLRKIECTSLKPEKSRAVVVEECNAITCERPASKTSSCVIASKMKEVSKKRSQFAHELTENISIPLMKYFDEFFYRISSYAHEFIQELCQ